MSVDASRPPPFQDFNFSLNRTSFPRASTYSGGGREGELKKIPLRFIFNFSKTLRSNRNTIALEISLSLFHWESDFGSRSIVQLPPSLPLFFL